MKLRGGRRPFNLQETNLSQQPFFYGGQAVIEGVMIRGRRHYSLAVRRTDGQIETLSEPLSQIYTGKLRRVPLIRGILVLIETLSLGIKALNKSASIAVDDQTQGQEEVSKWMMAVVIAFSLALGIGFFFLTPLFATRPLENVLSSDPTGQPHRRGDSPGACWWDTRADRAYARHSRVFAYHGAEHMAVHTHEAGLPLDVEHVRRFPTAHPRCGTAFLLTVAVVAIVVFAFLGREPLWWLISSRVVFIPVIAALSYEVIRFSGAHQKQPDHTVVRPYPG